MTVQISNMVDTWNDASVIYSGIKMDIADINSSANSTLISISVNSTDRFVVNKAGEIVNGSINANNVIGYANNYNYFLEQVNEAIDLASQYGSARLFESWSQLNSTTGAANTVAIITSDSGTHTDPVNANTVNNSGLYFWNVTPPGWKWVDNTLAYNAYESALVAQTEANTAVAAASTAVSSLSLIQTLVLSQKLYYATFAAAIAATVDGDMFTCDEGGSWAYYIRTNTSPFYTLYKYVITEDYLNSSIVGGANVYENWISLGTTSAANGTIGVVLTNDSGTHTDPIMANTVSNNGVFVRYPAGWKRLANTEAYDAHTAAVSANSSMNIALASAITSVAAANSASVAYDALKNVALSEGLYYPTIAAGVANTSNGYIFTTDESGTWNYYKKTTSSPFYEYFATVASPGALNVQTVYEFTAANNQNTFVTENTLTDLGVEVYANGFRLQTTDYTVSGNSVILDTNRANNDSIGIITVGSLLSSRLPASSVTFNTETIYANGTIGWAVNDRAPITHTHAITDVTGLTSVLANTVTIASLANTSTANTIGANDSSSGSLYTTIQGFINYLKTNVGSAVVGFLQAGTGALSRTVQSKLRETIHIKDYVVGDGSTNDLVAMQNLAAYVNGLSNGAAIYMGRSKVLLSGGSVLFTKPVTIVGEGEAISQFICASSASLIFNGGTQTPYSGASFNFYNVSFRNSGTHTDGPIKVTFGTGGDGTTPSCVFKDVSIQCHADGSSFAYGLWLENCSLVSINGLRIEGDRDSYPIVTPLGLKVTGTGGDWSVTNYAGYFSQTGVSIIGDYEGVRFDHATLVAVRNGIILSRGVDAANPWFSLTNSHINAENCCVSLTGVVEYNISNNEFYSQVADNSGTGIMRFIEIDTAANAGWSSNGLIAGNMFQGDLSAVSLANRTGVYFVGRSADAESCIITDNRFQSVGKAVHLTASTNGVVIPDTNLYNNVTTRVQNDAPTERNVVAGTTASGTNWSSTDTGGNRRAFGSAVVTLNASGDGTIAYTEPFQTFRTGTVCAGDPGVAGDASYSINQSSSNSTVLAFSVRPNPGPVTIRVNYTADGVI